ncbi:AAA family ATPase [Lasiodiplodia theobromae]|uniref:AAA family ATPase n=1 Tax=Lasiodiplodia theobromae TaxID=45133 RepID=UPI0015C2DB9B|nr:AAA family ATPase [Lasiodiplodia theobromae]KAF4545809.1 AAA family ATPase [Lasiodiplodia theobromae]
MNGPKDPGRSARTDASNQDGTKQAEATDFAIDAAYLVIHTVDCDSKSNEAHEGHAISASFLDHPRLFAGDSKASALRGKNPIEDVNSYIQQQENVCLVVYKVYHCREYHEDIKKDFVRTKLPNADLTVSTRIWPFLFILPRDSKEAKPEHESMAVLSDALRHCLEKLDPTLKPEDYSEPPPPPPPPPPGSLMPPPPPDLLDQKREMLRMDFPYLSLYHKRQAINEYIADNEDESRHQLLALQKYLNEELGEEYTEADKLFASGRVSKKHFQKLFGPDQVVVGVQDNQPQAYMCRKLEKIHPTLELQCWTWVFDGFFRKQETINRVKWPPEGEDTIKTKPRFMVDMKTYQLLHASTVEEPAEHNTISAEEMREEHPPGDDFPLLLPATVLGYGFHDKKWRSLFVDCIEEVDWNATAFERLVLDGDKKEIIEALVTVHTQTLNSTDLVEGKGNGLVMLLHGSPGTGKTLTAESVAELTEKPLYRVTCGDMGIDPEAVEKYLESVFHIGTIWGCVVLLDEADVFLEERSDADLARNALVSVFLRAVEYYDGILILTSNRVGKFDEAFKSRIQLAVHYPSLGQTERFKIWSKFINALVPEEDANVVNELNKHIHLLSQHELNGRQIRNTIKTARQLAFHKKQRLRFDHFERVISIANEFEKYLVKTRGGYTDDEIAMDGNIRAH